MKKIIFLLLPITLYSSMNILENWQPEVILPIQEKYQLNIFIKSAIESKDINSMFEIPIIFTYKLHQKLDFGLSFGPLAINKKNGTRIGINDLILGIKYQMTVETDTAPAIVSEFGFRLPTADYRNDLGKGAVGILLFWGVKKKLDILDAFFSLGYEINSENPLKIKYGNVFQYKIGALYPLSEDLSLIFDLKGFNSEPEIKNDKIIPDSAKIELYLSPSLKYISKSYSFTTSLLIGLTPESYNLAFLINLCL